MNKEEYKINKKKKAIESNVGKKNINYQGCEMEIIEYIDHLHIVVRFNDNYKYTCVVQPNDFKKGSVSNNFYPSLYGVGMIGNTNTSIDNKKKKSYLTWKGMLARCYDSNNKAKSYYNKCSVCDEWLIFENFEKWFDYNYYEIDNKKMCLDKDILIKGNKIYSPQTCVFVSNEINTMFTKNNARRGKCVIGVYFNSRRKEKQYYALCRFNEKNQKIIGRYDTEIEAFKAYKIAKENHIKQVADEYKSKYPNFPIKLYEAMYDYEVEITD